MLADFYEKNALAIANVACDNTLVPKINGTVISKQMNRLKNATPMT